MLKKIFSSIIILMALFLIIGFIVINYDFGGIIKANFEKKASEYLQVDVKVREIKLDLLAGNLSASDLKIYNPKGYSSPYFLEIKKLDASFDLLSILTNNIIINQVNIESPSMVIEFSLKNNNFQNIIKNLEAQTPSTNQQINHTPQENKSQKNVILDFLRINNLHLKTLAGVVEANVTLGEIHLENIGRGSNKLLFKQVLLIVLEQVYKDVLKANIKSPNINVDKTIKNIKDSFKHSINKAEDNIKKLF